MENLTLCSSSALEAWDLKILKNLHIFPVWGFNEKKKKKDDNAGLWASKVWSRAAMCPACYCPKPYPLSWYMRIWAVPILTETWNYYCLQWLLECLQQEKVIFLRKKQWSVLGMWIFMVVVQISFVICSTSAVASERGTMCKCLLK